MKLRLLLFWKHFLRRKDNKYFILLTILFILIVLLVFTVILLPHKHIGMITVKIPKGANLKEIANILKKNKVIQDKEGFIVLVKLYGKGEKLQAGWYKFSYIMNPRKVLATLLKGPMVKVKVVIPEGLTIEEIAHILKQKADIDSLNFVNLARDDFFVHSAGINANTAEGFLFPNTYIFSKGESSSSILSVMIKKTLNIIDDSLRERAMEMGYTIEQIITVASMIEKEAMLDRERPIIASVIYNRLKRRMRLQVDATVQYALPAHKNKLLYSDLRVKSPYNTYIHRGLPPGPIASPGLKSIEAAFHPARTHYLYYVSRGDGSHIFSKTMKAHIKAKRRVQRMRRNS